MTLGTKLIVKYYNDMKNYNINGEEDYETLVRELLRYAVEDENYEAAIILRDYLNNDDIFKTKPNH